MDEEFTRNQLRRCNVPPNHRPACSSISQQRCHPRAGHDSSGIRVNCRLAHSQGDAISKPNTAGFDRPPTNGQASTVQGTTTAYQQPNNPSQPSEEGKTTRERSQAKGETQLKSSHTAQLFLALTWPKQLSHNTPKDDCIHNNQNQGNSVKFEHIDL